MAYTSIHQDKALASSMVEDSFTSHCLDITLR